jgi:hypothetical protein
MNAATLIRQLTDAGIRLSPNGERLRVEGKPGTVTPELRALIVNRKADLLAELGHARDAARATRQAKVEAELRAHLEMQLAFDVTETPLKAGPGEPVSVVLAVRHGEHILSGELHVPRERWATAVFLRTVDPGSQRLS